MKKSKKLIKKSLEEYKELIDSKKPDELSLSSYTVDKPWGEEKWLELNKYYAYKLIAMKKGCKSSLQLHEFKYESNFVIQGEAEVLLENENGELVSKIFKAGEGWTVPIGRVHRVIAHTDYMALEVSTPHLNDVVRLEDDSKRESGKITGEHGA